ncbi:MAG: ATP-binding protein [Fibrobacter intestinalis]|uniref:PD-(D/E)XK nuclease superfamily protein n=1 Tax=Fibrobacter intestinalis TaxID=28122 RepID=A0A1T4M8X6_9BACT|nr:MULTISPECIES: ATP-binding protein [Fibrobacter]PBC73582.1 PD-(D/E)XK nuclease superfamily protein [Fibrobacter sp. NR9]SJZ63238.1 PD-(D/E)XK nuclease superfamily protein [Fibrobacter intestinalis]
MALKRFPIGVQDFARIREDGKYYVDKTDLIYKLAHSEDYYFLSRPRRFGKSLLVSTLQCYFEGRRELFAGLAMEKLETEWKKHPVFKLSFAGNKFVKEQDLADTLNLKLGEWERMYGLAPSKASAWGTRFEVLLKAAYESAGVQPVVLVDEYDAPLLDSMENPELQQTLKEEMRKLFSPLKDLGGILRFVFLTGISKFSQLSIFSELNNLKVITMNDEYAGICGITKEEVFTQMQPEIQALAGKNGMSYDEACEALKQKYDGYHFSKNSPDVFNPFSLINSLSDGELANYWFATGTPTVLTKLMSRYKVDPQPFDGGFDATLDMFDAPTETATNPIPMLYQSGYLTIKGFDGFSYTLGFPNDEVRLGFLKALMPYYAKDDVVDNDSFILCFTKSFRQNRLEDAMAQIRAFLSSIPYNAERQDENHYKTVLFLIFKLCTPYVVRAEECSAAGRADAVVETADSVYVFEFKLDGSGTAEDALAQIDSRGYLIPYTATPGTDGNPKKLYKIGASFDSEKRTIGEWLVREG